MTAVYKYASPLGEITIAGSEKGVTGLWLEGQKYFAETLPGDCTEEMLPVFKQTKNGWMSISAEESRIFCLLCSRKDLRSERRSGRSCWRFLMDRL